MRETSVQVWSDIACPWCYVGKRRLEAAIARLPHPGAVTVTWRSFELDPGAPRAQPDGIDYAERLARKYRCSRRDAEAMIERMTAVAAGDGLSFRFDRIQPGNTFDAHRVLHHARHRGVQAAVKERLLRGYMAEGERIGDRETLARLSGEAGLDSAEVLRVLETEAYAAEVREDEAEAHRLGIHAVPFFVLDGVYGVSGAQPVEVLHRALQHAASAAPGACAAGASCGPDGCE